jgi:hypothetical protein
MVTVMRKRHRFPAIIAIFALHAAMPAAAMAGPAAIESGPLLLQIRDARTAAGGGGDGGGNGGANSCWSSCFGDYSQCMDAGPKNVCVSRMKTCLEVCDRLSNRPGM